MGGFRLKGAHGVVQVDQDYECPALVWKGRIATDIGGPSVFDPGAAQTSTHPTSRRELTIGELTSGPYSIAISAVGSVRACLPVTNETSGGLNLILYADGPVGSQIDVYVFGPPPPVGATSGFRVRNPATKKIVFHSGLKYMRIVDDQPYEATLGQTATFTNLDPAKRYAAVQGLAAFGWHFYPNAGGFGAGAGAIHLIQGAVPELTGASTRAITTMTFDAKPAGNTGSEASDGNRGRFFLVAVTGF